MRWFLLAVVLVGCAAWAFHDLAGQKILTRLIMPLGLLWLGLLAAMIAALWYRRWLVAGGCLLAAAILTIGASQALGSRLLASLEAAHPPLTIATCGPFDAVFVCGGGTGVRPDDLPQFGAAGDRLTTAFELWRQERTPLLIASGSSIPGVDEPRDLARETSILWQRLGIPASAIATLPGPPNTAGEIAAYAEYAKQHGLSRIAIVSSAWHLARIEKLCAANRVSATLIGTDYQGRARSARIIDWIPSAGGVTSIQQGLWEYLGMLVGR